MDWIKRAAESEELRQPARLAIRIMQDAGVDFGQSVFDLLAPLPDTPPDTALLMLRDEVNSALREIPVRLAMLAATPKKKGDRIALLYSDPWNPEQFDELQFWHGLAKSLDHPPKFVRLCPQCGKIFTPKRSTGVYCSDTCRSAARFN